MKGFIFAAGFGERLLPVTELMPKPLVPVVNVPAICYSLLLLKEAGIDSVVCNLHYKYSDIIKYFEANQFFGFNVSFSVEEKIMGTGGGLKLCEKELCDDDFFILNSDVIMDIDLRALAEYHKSNSSIATIVLYNTDRANQIGPVAVKENRVLDFKNFLKTDLPCNHIYTGAAILSPEIFDYLTHDFSSIVYTAYTDIIQKHDLYFYDYKGLWKDIGTIESYRLTNIDMLTYQNNYSARFKDVFGIGMNAVSPNAKIASKSIIRNSVIGDDCVIEESCEIEESVMLCGSKAGKSSIIKNRLVLP